MGFILYVSCFFFLIQNKNWGIVENTEHNSSSKYVEEAKQKKRTF